MRPALPVNVLPVDQSDVSLVDEGAGLECVAGALAAHVVVREAVQLLVHQRGQPFESRLVAIAPSDEPRDLLR